MSITPFGFDRVFRFGSNPEDDGSASPAMDDLHAQIAGLEEQFEQLRHEQEQAVLAAYSEGVAQGLVQARGERAEAMLAATDALHAGLDDLSSQLAQVSDRITRDAADFALCAAELIAGHALSLQPGRAVDEALGRALKQVARGTVLQVRVHPESLEDVERLIAARGDREGRAPPITIIEDLGIAPHDAHISWAEGGLMVDAAARRAAVERELGSLIGSDEGA